MRSRTGQEALRYLVELNWCVLPAYWTDVRDGVVRCTCKRGAECGKPGKHPIGYWNSRDVPWPLEESVLAARFRRKPLANIALLTGVRSRVVVADVDPRHDGRLETLWELGWSQNTCIGRSGGGGWHVYADCPIEGLASVDSYAQGIELKADGKLVILPPSIHPSQQPYEWGDGHAPWDRSPADLPKSILAGLAPPTPPRPARSATERNAEGDREPIILTDEERERLSKKAPGLVERYAARAKFGKRHSVMKLLSYQLWSLGISEDELVYWLLEYQKKVEWL